MPNLHAPVLLPSGSGRGVGGGVFLGLFGVLALMACLKYLALHSTVFDLGVFLSNLYSLHNDGQWWRAFLGHAQPLLPVFAQVYRLVPDQAAPLVLLTVQALVLALPALWAARRFGMLAALAYALYFPVWTNALFDFHLDHLLIPMLFAFLAAATSGRYKLAFVLGLLPALVKEPYALTTVFCGLHLLLVAKQSRAGWGLILLGGLYFYVATAWVVPFCTADGGLGAQSGAYAWLGGGPGAALLTFATHPGRVLAEVFGVPGKWKYLGFLFGALLFFPIFRPKLLLPAVPALLLSLLSTEPNYYGWANHYTAGAAGALFYAFCEVLGPVRILARQSGNGVQRFGLGIFLALALGHVMLAPSPVSRLFWATDNFAFSIDAYEPTARDAAILTEILRSVPRDPALPVVSQNTLNWGALAERLDYNSFPLGVFTPHPVRDLSGATWKDFWLFVRTGQTPNLPVRTWQAGYVLLDLTRPWFVLDRGCEYRNGVCHDENVAGQFNALVIQARQELETVYDQGGFLILRRPQPLAPAPTQTTPAPADAPEIPAGSETSPASPTSQMSPPAPSRTPAPGASQPALQPPAAAEPSPEAGSGVEVEVLDRFPTPRRGTKPLPAVTPPGGEPSAQPAGQEAPAPSSGLPPEAAPATEGQPQPARPSHKRKQPAVQPVPAAPLDGLSAPAGQEAPAQGSGVAPEAAPATEGQPQPARPSRKRKQSAVQPAPAAPLDGLSAPAGQEAPAQGSGVAPEAAPATESQPQPVRPSRKRRSPTGQTTPAAPSGDAAAPETGATVTPPALAVPSGDAVAPDTPSGEVKPKPVRRSRRPKEPAVIPAPTEPAGGDHAPSP